MITRRMAPAELRAIINAAHLKTEDAARMAAIEPYQLADLWYGDDNNDLLVPAPVSRMLCTHLLAMGLATDLVRPWVPDELAELLAPSICPARAALTP